MRVGHYEPEIITVVGEGVFQRITLSLPRDNEVPKYEQLRRQAEDNIMAEGETDMVSWLIDWLIDFFIDLS